MSETVQMNVKFVFEGDGGIPSDALFRMDQTTETVYDAEFTLDDDLTNAEKHEQELEASNYSLGEFDRIIRHVFEEKDGIQSLNVKIGRESTGLIVKDNFIDLKDEWEDEFGIEVDHEVVGSVDTNLEA